MLTIYIKNNKIVPSAGVLKKKRREKQTGFPFFAQRRYENIFSRFSEEIYLILNFEISFFHCHRSSKTKKKLGGRPVSVMYQVRIQILVFQPHMFVPIAGTHHIPVNYQNVLRISTCYSLGTRFSLYIYKAVGVIQTENTSLDD